MRLVVTGMATASQKFVQLWGMHVAGFKAEEHCIYCLKGKKEPLLHREMSDIDITLPTDSAVLLPLRDGAGAQARNKRPPGRSDLLQA